MGEGCIVHTPPESATDWQQQRGVVASMLVAELLFIGSGFDPALGFDFIFNALGFLRVIRGGVE